MMKKQSVFWVEVDKINPNPYQPRKEFNDDSLKDMANSIRQYGILTTISCYKKRIKYLKMEV